MTPTRRAMCCGVLVKLLDEPGSNVIKVNQYRWNEQVDILLRFARDVERETWLKALEIASAESMIDRIGGSTGNAWGTQKRIVDYLREAQARAGEEPQP